MDFWSIAQPSPCSSHRTSLIGNPRDNGTPSSSSTSVSRLHPLWLFFLRFLILLAYPFYATSYSDTTTTTTTTTTPAAAAAASFISSSSSSVTSFSSSARSRTRTRLFSRERKVQIRESSTTAISDGHSVRLDSISGRRRLLENFSFRSIRAALGKPLHDGVAFLPKVKVLRRERGRKGSHVGET